MASATDKVMQFVEKQLAKDPKVSNATLFAGAKKIDRGVGKLSIRQFHAKYPLQVKRRKGRARSKAAKARTRSARPKAARAARPAARRGGDGEGIRRVLLRFARDLSAADSQVETIEVLSNLDRYTAEILKAARG